MTHPHRNHPFSAYSLCRFFFCIGILLTVFLCPSWAAPKGRIAGPFNVGKIPEMIAADPSGNVWVTNYPGNSVTKLSASGSILGTFAVGGVPYGIAINRSGSVFVATGPNTVVKLSSSGSILMKFLMDALPTNLAIDPSGNVWVTSEELSDSGYRVVSAKVTELNSSGLVLRSFRLDGQGADNIAIDSSGNVWVTGKFNRTVTKLSASAALLGTFPVDSMTGAISVDGAGNVWVAMTTVGNTVMKLDSSGHFLGHFPAGHHAARLAIDRSDNVWVTNADDNTVSELNSSGSVLATFPVGQHPWDITADSSGNVWVANRWDRSVTKILGPVIGKNVAALHNPQPVTKSLGHMTGKNATPLHNSQGPASPTTKISGFYDPAKSGDFDVLDGIRVNPKKGTVILYGHHDRRGAVRSVPYLDYLAAALESHDPTFSLEWTPKSRQTIDRAFSIADQELTNQLAHVMEGNQLTKRGAWWFRMLGVDVQEGMDKMSLWMAVFPAAGYPDAGKVVEAADEVERAGSALNQKVMDPDGHPRSPMEHLINAAASLVVPIDLNFLNTENAALNGDAEARETLLSWVFRGMARAYKLDEGRYINRYESLQRSGTEWSTAFAEVLNMSQDDTVDLQKNAFHALVGDRTFIHVPPDIMRDALGVNPVVVPVFQGLARNSLLAKVAFDADVFGKNLMDMPEIKSDVPTYRTYFEWRQTVDRAPASEGHTWFAPHGFELFESADGRTVWFGKTPIRIYMESYENTGASGRQSVADPLLKRYADELTALYDPLAAKFPVLLDLRESMKVMAIADWLKRKRIKLSLPTQGRGSWDPPATYPGVINMEIAVKQAPVGEVMSASGGIDFRVDGNWDLVKEAIEAQPGPPPAHGVIIGYNPNSGIVTGVNPLNASAWAPSATSTSSLSPSHAATTKQNNKTRGPVTTGSATPLPRESTTLSGSKPASVSPQAKSPTCSQTLAGLRIEVSVIQKALHGLNQAMEHNQHVREESEMAIDSAVDEGKDKLLSAFIDLTGNVFDDRLAAATGGQKDEIARVIDRFEKLEAANNLSEIDKSLSNHDSSRLERFYDLGTKFLGDPLVQKVFNKFLKPAATPLKVGDAIRGDLDAGYLLGSEYLNWQNIKQLNKNSDQYLKAVKDLRAKLETVIKKIKMTENEMRQSKVSGCQ